MARCQFCDRPHTWGVGFDVCPYCDGTGTYHRERVIATRKQINRLLPEGIIIKKDVIVHMEPRPHFLEHGQGSIITAWEWSVAIFSRKEGPARLTKPEATQARAALEIVTNRSWKPDSVSSHVFHLVTHKDHFFDPDLNRYVQTKPRRSKQTQITVDERIKPRSARRHSANIAQTEEEGSHHNGCTEDQ